MANGNWVTGKIKVTLAGRPLEMQMTVPADPVKPHRMLPVFQQMTNSFVGMSVEAAEKEGKKVSCAAGCGACCRQPVPLSEVEVYHVAEVVNEMPEPRKTFIRERFARGNAHFESIGWYQKVQDCRQIAEEGRHEEAARTLEKLVGVYFAEGIACPFLEDESCSIHEVRPLACREYLVSSPPANCSQPDPETVTRIPIAITPSKALKNIGTTGAFAQLGLLPMIRALDLADKTPEHFVEKTGERWVADFFAMMAKTDIPKKGIRQKSSARVPRRKKRK
ncbi:hypothetical protein BH24ACI3_BH24ACI3_10840 [soil metagenome]